MRQVQDWVQARKKKLYYDSVDLENTFDRILTALHTLNNTVAKGFNQMAPLARTITVALDMSKAFNAINIHTPIRNLLQTRVPGTIISSSQTTSRDANPTQHTEITHPHNVKTGVPQVGPFHQHYLTFTVQTCHRPEHRFRSWSTITSASTSAAKKYMQPYLHKVFASKKQNNLTLNPHKTTCPLFGPDPAEYKSNLDLKINNTAIPMSKHPNLQQQPLHNIHSHIPPHSHYNRHTSYTYIYCL